MDLFKYPATISFFLSTSVFIEGLHINFDITNAVVCRLGENEGLICINRAPPLNGYLSKLQSHRSIDGQETQSPEPSPT